MNRLFGIAAMGVLLLAGGTGTVDARTAVPVIQFENQSWAAPAGRAFTESQVREKIIRAIQSHKAGWQVASDAPGKIGASVMVRGKHSVQVAINYTASNFSVTYLSSVNMDAHTGDGGVTMIHPKYNGWVGDLVRSIRDELSRP
jgi:hypothetical protein